MARIRTIKPEFFSSPGIETLDFSWRVLYIAMWNWADDTGRGTAEARELMGFAFPLDEDMAVGEFRRGLGEVRRVFGVTFYKVDGRSYYAIPAWDKHQKIDKRSGSKWPSPEDGAPYDPTTNSAPIKGTKAHSAESHEDPPNTRGELGVGTGEQGNRGTGEQGVKDLSSAAADDEPEQPEVPFDIPEQEPAAPAGVTYSADFLLFWDVYPEKKAKQAALTAWKAARRTASVSEILVGAKRYAEDPNRDPGFTAHPAKWLKDGRWEDAPLPARRGPQQFQSSTDRNLEAAALLDQKYRAAEANQHQLEGNQP